MSENLNLKRQIETLQERIDQLVQKEKRSSQVGIFSFKCISVYYTLLFKLKL